MSRDNPPVYTVGSFAKIDGDVAHRNGPSAEDASRKSGFPVRKLTICPLSMGWPDKLPPDNYLCGSAPVDALADALRLIQSGEEELVEISGVDPLRTGYTRDERRALMEIYPALPSVAHGYDLLAKRFLELKGISLERFMALRELLIKNYLRTFRGSDEGALPPRSLEPVTELFRAVDCANPVIDFEGSIVVGSARVLEALKLDKANTVRVLSAESAALESDGPEAIGEIARFDHLREVAGRAARAAGVELPEVVRECKAHLEAYTCFPVVPLAFLMETGICDLDGLEEALATLPLTVTGGMNLARGPWNNPALHALIAMQNKLLEGDRPLGVVHGNGGLGYRQAVALLGRGG